MAQHISISIREFRCPDGHTFTQTCRLVRRSGTDEYEEFYRSINSTLWLPVPKCPIADCALAGDELADVANARTFAQVPESERLYCWLSTDGERVPIPGYRGAKMPERYKRAGYIAFEASSLRDLDRIERIRARQTGNEVYSEVGNFSAASRKARQRAEYTDDLTVDV